MNTFSGSLRPAHAKSVLGRWITTALVTTVAATGLSVATTSSATAVTAAATGSPAMAPDTYERRVQYWINQRRAEHGLPALRIASCTDTVAEKWAGYLASNDQFYHQDMGTLLDKCNAMYAGETLGRGAITPKRLVYLWMHSDGHRAVLLSGQARRIGIGSKPDAYGRWVTAANFMAF